MAKGSSSTWDFLKARLDIILGQLYDYHGPIEKPEAGAEKIWATPSNLPNESPNPQDYFLHYFQTQLTGPTPNECVTTSTVMGMNIMEDHAASGNNDPIKYFANLRLENYTCDLDARGLAGWLYRFSTKSPLPGMMTPWQAVLALRHHARKLDAKYGRSFKLRIRPWCTVDHLIKYLKQGKFMLIHGSWRIKLATAKENFHLPFLGGMPHTMLLVGYDPTPDSWLILDPAKNLPPSIRAMTTEKLVEEFWGRQFLFYPPRFSVTTISPSW